MRSLDSDADDDSDGKRVPKRRGEAMDTIACN